MKSVSRNKETAYCMRFGLIEPDTDSREQLRIRSGSTVDGCGAIFTLIEPETVCRWISAGGPPHEAD